MNTSIFKGHVIQDSESKALYESKEFAKSHPFNNKHDLLKNLGVDDWEQLYSIMKIESLKESVKTTLHLNSEEEFNELLAISESLVPQPQLRKLDEIEIMNCPLGAFKPQEKQIKETFKVTESFKVNKYTEISSMIEVNKKVYTVESFKNFTFASSVNLIPKLNPIRSQGKRGTCTAFAVTAANEYSHLIKSGGNRYDLSEQYLFNETKLTEQNADCGAWIKNAMLAISSKGQCQEGIWSYNPNLPCVQPSGKPFNADPEAAIFRNTFFQINQSDIDALKQALMSARLVAFSIPVFDSWYKSKETYRTGRITMPLTNEAENGGHSMVLAGYQDTPNAPGGGYFLIRNSWGISWGLDCHYGQGYGVIPYAYIQNLAWETFSF